MNLKNTQRIIFGIFAIVGAGMFIGGVAMLVTPGGSSAMRDGRLFAGLILLFMGVIFGLVGIIPLMNINKQSRKHEYLLNNGKVLMAKIESIYLDTTMSVNGYNPYVVTCTYTDEYSGQIMRFKSHRIWEGDIGMAAVGQEIKVYVDPADYHTYYVSPESALSESQQNIINM